ncbi:MAG TPA: hypothetical protein H9761_08400 [Candidatus Eisenbergiella merdavium]|uniref:Esterase n=1 Tax=Candidatus Eisenbergiella merdavium TaxID=2838551 RepID=A0A9D2NF79_9FIRM|nr:hypothetical protein [Candidatus Eisenbergiella merdavium]
MEKKEYTWFSRALGEETMVTAGIPKGVKGPLPVLWIDGPGSCREWFEHTGIEEYAERAGLAVVEVDSSKSWGGRDIEDGHYFFETFLTRELPEYLRERELLSDRPEDNYITGWSRAAYMALRIGLHHPELYGNIICCSGGNVDAYGLYKDIKGMYPGLLERMFDGISDGMTFENSIYNPERFVEDWKNAGKAFPRMLFYCGSEDPLARVPCVRLSEKMKLWGIPHGFELLPGIHSWETVDASIRLALEEIEREKKGEN